MSDMKKRIPIPYAIIFINDNDNDAVDIPEYNDNVVSFNDSCISVGTIHEVDGDVDIELTKEVSNIPNDFYN